jgi:hypothetical protein
MRIFKQKYLENFMDIASIRYNCVKIREILGIEYNVLQVGSFTILL